MRIGIGRCVWVWLSGWFETLFEIGVGSRWERLCSVGVWGWVGLIGVVGRPRWRRIAFGVGFGVRTRS